MTEQIIKPKADRIYQFIVLPSGVLLRGDIGILNVMEVSSESAITRARESIKDKNLILIGSQDVGDFLRILGLGTDPAAAPSAPRDPPDRTPDRTEEQIGRLVLYLKDKGYRVTAPAKRKKAK